MKRFLYVILCVICAAAGTGLGHYGWKDPDTTARERGTGREPPKPLAGSAGKSKGALHSHRRLAEIFLATAARGESDRLPALIDACGYDAMVLELLASTWMKIDPAAFARAMANSSGLKDFRRGVCSAALSNMIHLWGKTDPDAAWSTTEKLSGNLRRNILSQLALDRVSHDAKEGLEFVLRHPGVVPPGPTNSMNGRRDLVPLVQQLPDCYAKFQLLKNALKGVPLAESLAAVGSSPEMANMYIRRILLREASKNSLEEVIAFHESATGPDRYAAAHAVGDVLVSKDPAAAVEWARENLSGGIRNGIINVAAKALQAKEPAAAEAARALLPEGFAKQ